MAPSTSFTTGMPTNVLLDSGILFINATTPWAASTGGGFKFDPGHSFQNLAQDVDGVHYPVGGLDRKVGGVPKLTGTVVELDITRILQIEPGSSNATVTTETTTTPGAVGELIAVGSLLTDVRAVWKRGDGTFVAVKFPLALVTKYDITGNEKEKGAISIEIEARQAQADVSTGAAPYKLYFGAANTLGES